MRYNAVLSVLILVLFQLGCSDTGSINGTVTSTAEVDMIVPVEGADVTTIPWTSWTKSDTSGHYSLDDLPPGTYVVRASEPLTWAEFAGYGTASVEAGKNTRADITIQLTMAEITYVDSTTAMMELFDIVPSLTGTANLTLTKTPSDSLDLIVWHSVSIRSYSLEIKQVASIRVVGEPLTYHYQPYADTFYFYPIELVPVSGEPEVWFWQGKHLIGWVIDSGIRKSTSIPLDAIRSISFIHL